MRSGMVAVVGRPNVGKSSLVNALIGRKVSIVTRKPQTTRHRIQGVIHRGGGQVVLVDTPGLHLKQGRVKFLGSYPIAGEPPDHGGEPHDARWDAAQDWVSGLQSMIEE